MMASNILFLLGLVMLILFWPGGVLLILVAIVLWAIAKGQPKPARKYNCPHCGNPVAPTSNLCPTCQGTILPTEGPLAPPTLNKKGEVITVETPAAARRSTAIALSAGLLIIAVLVVIAIIAANNLH